MSTNAKGARFDDGKDLFDFLPARPETASEVERLSAALRSADAVLERATEDRAAVSAFALIVVESVGKLPGAMMGAWLFATGLPVLVSICT